MLFPRAVDRKRCKRNRPCFGRGEDYNTGRCSLHRRHGRIVETARCGRVCRYRQGNEWVRWSAGRWDRRVFAVHRSGKRCIAGKNINNGFVTVSVQGAVFEDVRRGVSQVVEKLCGIAINEVSLYFGKKGCLWHVCIGTFCR